MLGKNLRLASLLVAKQNPDGSVIARFRTGSEPVVRAMQYCKKTDGKQVFRVELSEPVFDPSEGDAAVVTNPATAARVTCAAKSYPFPAGSIDVQCAPLPDRLTITLSSALRAASGVNVGQAFTFALSALPSWGGPDCGLFRP